MTNEKTILMQELKKEGISFAPSGSRALIVKGANNKIEIYHDVSGYYEIEIAPVGADFTRVPKNIEHVGNMDLVIAKAYAVYTEEFPGTFREWQDTNALIELLKLERETTLQTERQGGPDDATNKAYADALDRVCRILGIDTFETAARLSRTINYGQGER